MKIIRTKWTKQSAEGLFNFSFIRKEEYESETRYIRKSGFIYQHDGKNH